MVKGRKIDPSGKANIIIRDASKVDYQDIVDLNAGEVQYTSAMDIDIVHHLDSLAACHRVAVLEGKVAAFILAMEDHVSYENDNYSWFSSRYDRFLYIDRIVVDSPCQGLKIGTFLYQDIFDYARKEKIPVITCEIMTFPPNERSLKFHAGKGFREVGTRWVDNGQKQYSMQASFIEMI